MFNFIIKRKLEIEVRIKELEQLLTKHLTNSQINEIDTVLQLIKYNQQQLSFYIELLEEFKNENKR